MALDPYADYNVLNLAFDGLNGSSIFHDYSKYGIGAYPNAGSISTTNPPFSELPEIGSLLLNGSSTNYANVFTKNIAFGASDDLTIETRYRLTSASGVFIAIFDGRGGASPIPLMFGLRHVSGTYRAELYNNEDYKYSASNYGITGSWISVGMQRKSGVYEYYLNGTKDANTYTNAIALECNSIIATIGKLVDGVYMNGNIAYLRITKGVARLSDGYTPPVAPVAYKGLQLDGSAFITLQTPSGVPAAFSDGAIATKAVAFARSAGVVIGEAVPDPTTGAFSMLVPDLISDGIDVMIYRDGYRPLIHGPISATAS